MARRLALPSLTRAAAVNALGTGASRLTGFMRDIALAQTLGAGLAADVFVVAFRFPNLFRRLFAEGAFNAAFLPLFSDALAQSRAAAQAFAGQIFLWLFLALSLLCAAAMLGMDGFIYLIAQGFAAEPAKLDLAITHSRIAFPYLFFMGQAALFGAVLNAQGRFGATAFAPILLNLVLLAAMGAAALRAAAPLPWLSGGIVVAGALQWGALWLAARRVGWRLSPLKLVRTDAQRRFFQLFLPGVLAAGIGQINLLIGTSIASAQAGAAAWLYYADRLYQLPLGVIGVGLGVVLLPRLARAIAQKHYAAAAASQTQAMRLALYFALPAAFGLYWLAAPIMQVLFERGAFQPADSAAAAAALRAFVWGLPAFVLVKMLQPIFFAQHNTRGPMWDGAGGVAVNIALSLLLFQALGHVAIAFATSAAGWVTFGLMWRRARRLPHALLPRLRDQLRFAAGLAAGLFMLSFFVRLYIATLPMPAGLVGQLAWLGGAVVGGAMGFFLFSLALGGRPDTSRQQRTG